METFYLFLVLFLGVLAVFDLSVGVSNDAVNFLNASIGSKAASFRVIMIVAATGILVGAALSNGMMDIARHGIYQPQYFYFSEIMCILVAVMLTDVVLLDIFNSLGMPTSTTVSLVFELLGGTVAYALIKIANDTEGIYHLGNLMNTDKALTVILAIFVSVAIAFIFGTLVQYISRIIFTFNYKRTAKYFIGLFGGMAATAIIYFMLIKGLKSSPIFAGPFSDYIFANTQEVVLGCFIGFTILMQILHWLHVNVFKVIVLMGTFALALAFAGNDLVNFIGVPLAGVSAYEDFMAQGGSVTPDSFLMTSLQGSAQTPWYYLIGAGIVMVIALLTSKKAHNVIKTSVDLSRQSEGEEQFGTSPVARVLVRVCTNAANNIVKVIPTPALQWIDRRFNNKEMIMEEGAAFDLVRASVNVVLSGLLIAVGTSLKLPLSTTYVAFMVAMGSSLADRAWGRESAVYRITGVLTVIAGWFLTALIAFTIAFLIALGLMWGGMIAVVIFAVVCGYMLIQSSIIHNRKVKKEAEREAEEQTEAPEQTVIQRCVREVAETMLQVTTLYRQTLVGLFNEDRKLLKQMVRESEELYRVAHERKHEMLPTLLKLQENYIETGHYYVQVVDYINEVTKALVHITRPSFDHINNNHEGLNKEQVADLELVNEKVGEIYQKINVMLENNDFSQLDEILQMRDKLFDALAAAIKSQIKRVKAKASTTRSSILYLTIINETKTMVLQTRNLLKSQRYFISGD